MRARYCSPVHLLTRVRAHCWRATMTWRPPCATTCDTRRLSAPDGRRRRSMDKMDEFDLEVAPLGPPTAAESGPAERLAPKLAPFAPRLSPRARMVRAGGILSAVLLALAILVAVTPGVRSAVAGLVLGPTPTPTPLLPVGQARFPP